MDNIVAFMGKTPCIDSNVFIDPSCRIIGDVILKNDTSVWPLSVLRADSNRIVIEEGSAVLDHVMIEAPAKHGVAVGKKALISHGAKIHGATVQDGALVGIGAIVLDGAVIGRGSIIGAGCVIPPGMVVPENSLVLGLPGKVIRPLRSDEIQRSVAEVEEVRQKAAVYLKAAASR
jgi:carbonic anhydrase/acetyltransferase-like protein (isoleucine patch superfamily)